MRCANRYQQSKHSTWKGEPVYKAFICWQSRLTTQQLATMARFTDLPTELRRSIYNYFNFATLLKARLCCKSVKLDTQDHLIKSLWVAIASRLQPRPTVDLYYMSRITARQLVAELVSYVEKSSCNREISVFDFHLRSLINVLQPTDQVFLRQSDTNLSSIGCRQTLVKFLHDPTIWKTSNVDMSALRNVCMNLAQFTTLGNRFLFTLSYVLACHCRWLLSVRSIQQDQQLEQLCRKETKDRILRNIDNLLVELTV